MKFFADHNVSERACLALEEEGHEVVRLRDTLAINTVDPIVARLAEKSGAVLISHDGDFRQIAPRIPKGERARFRRLSKVHLQCRPSQSAQWIMIAMSLIQFEYDLAQRSSDKRMHIIVQNTGIKTNR